MPNLFDTLSIRDITLKNRIAVSPMCQYSSANGIATDWHAVHLGSRAVGGAGLVICEATSVSAIGRISPGDAGIWSDEHIPPLQKINKFIHSQGAISGIQLAHAGRKASTCVPWETKARTDLGLTEKLSIDEGGWEVIAPSSLPFRSSDPESHAMTIEEIHHVTAEFKTAAIRALHADYQWLEIHAAHGYLINTFLSPLSNKRTDTYGGKFENRIRMLMEITHAVRQVWPEKLPLAVRLSATDWVEGGWTIEDSIALAKNLKLEGVDLIDCSSGGLVPGAKIPVGPGYQVHLAEQIKAKSTILTGAVGMITEAHQANKIIESGQADIVLLARELLRHPYWPLHAANQLGLTTHVPEQYERGFI